MPRFHLGRGPFERNTFAGQFVQGLAKRGDGLVEPRRPALPLAERCERNAETALGVGPLERRAYAGRHIQRGTVHLDCIQQCLVVAKLVALQVKCAGSIQHVAPGSGGVECRRIGRLCIKVGCLSITQLQPGDAAAFGQQSGMSTGAVLVIGFGLGQCRVQDLCRIGEFEFLRARLRFGEHPFHRAGEILRLGGGLLQFLDDTLHETWQFLGGGIVDVRLTGAQQVAYFDYGPHRRRAAASGIHHPALKLRLPLLGASLILLSGFPQRFGVPLHRVDLRFNIKKLLLQSLQAWDQCR